MYTTRPMGDPTVKCCIGDAENWAVAIQVQTVPARQSDPNAAASASFSPTTRRVAPARALASRGSIAALDKSPNFEGTNRFSPAAERPCRTDSANVR
jgi:hypothetical protein